MPRKLLILIFCVFATNISRGQIITTIAGTGSEIYNGDSIIATTASLCTPDAIAFDSIGNIYITDGCHNRIRMVNTDGIMYNIAGTGNAGYNGDGIPASSAEVNYPTNILIDKGGNIYFYDDHNYRIRKIGIDRIITTIAGTGTNGYNGDNIPATTAQISTSGGLIIDKDGNIYFCDIVRNAIRKIGVDGIITSFAGTGVAGYSGDGGPATIAKLHNPFSLAQDKQGSFYIGEYTNYCIRKIDSMGIISTIAGTGHRGIPVDGDAATISALNFPSGLAVDNSGNVIFADVNNNVLMVIGTDGYIHKIAGTGAGGYNGDNILASLAELRAPSTPSIDAKGDIYIADWGNNRIRLIKNTVGVTSINNFAYAFSVYPNPANSTINVNLNMIFTEPIKLSVSNLIGQFIIEFTITTNKDNEINLDVPDGLYILTANTTNGPISQKITINH